MNESKKKFTIFDILIGAAILLVIGAIAYVLVVSPMTQKKTDTSKHLDFVVGVQASTLDVVAMVNEGDTVTISGKSQATLTKLEYEPAIQSVIDQVKGEYVEAQIPDKYDINVTVSSKANESENDISIGNMPVKVGMSVSIQGKGYSINGYVLDMTLTDENGEVIEND